MNKHKLHFGCGTNKLDGWQNLDLPNTDVRVPLKYSNSSIDFIFHEHLLEHLDEVDGYNFLNECYRILKPQGAIRISCPSIDGFIHCYQNWDNINQEFKNKFGTKTRFINHATLGEAAFFNAKKFNGDGTIGHINNGNSWHKYYYDKEDLYSKLNKIGFSGIQFVDKHESTFPELKVLERRLGGKFINFPKELDITVEAIKI